MSSPLLASLLFACCLLALPHTEGFNKVDHLQELIKSQRSRSNLSSHWKPNKELHQVYVGPQDGLMEADKIDVLPGQPQGVTFDQYAGYVTVDPSAGRALFYYFTESPHDPSTKPLVLWLNGGLRCSSLGDGAMVQLGPFRPNSDGKTLQANHYAWNNVANVIFLESPVGAGYSYSNTSSDYNTNGDKRNTKDSYTFLVNWLDRFPQYKTHDFFITGNNYAGHYIPELASTILAHNKITNRTVINLKGIAIGNANVDDNIKARYGYHWSHALISDETYENIKLKCNKIYTAECIASLRPVNAEMGNISIYNIYAPLCRGQSKAADLTRSLKEVDPCVYDYVTSYLNHPEVQRALHANVTSLPYPWSTCGAVSNWTDSPTTMLPTIKELVASGIRFWMYSGDQDSLVPVTSTRGTIRMLGLPIEASWRPWYTNGQVGGYVVAYKGLTFATVRGAGHMVPMDQGDRALTLISSFLQGKLPPAA